MIRRGVETATRPRRKSRNGSNDRRRFLLIFLLYTNTEGLVARCLSQQLDTPDTVFLTRAIIITVLFFRCRRSRLPNALLLHLRSRLPAQQPSIGQQRQLRQEFVPSTSPARNISRLAIAHYCCKTSSSSVRLQQLENSASLLQYSHRCALS